MKVLMAHTWHHRRGGDSVYTWSLAERLRARGHTVVPLSMRHPDNEPSPWEAWFVPQMDARNRWWRSARRFVWNREAERLAAGLIDAVRPDVLHLNHVHRHLTPAVIAPARSAGIPVVWTVHDYELVCPTGHLFTAGAPCEACRGHRYQSAVVRRCRGARSVPMALEKTLHHLWGLWDMVDRFVVPSKFVADTLVRFGLPAERVFHLPNFVEAGETADGPGAGWLFAGRLTDHKGIDVLLEAARQVDAPLTVCGTGPEAGRLQRQAPDVRFLGRVSAERVRAELAAAAVVAVPSIWYENFPYAVLEAQAAGRAVVASAIGGIPEQIRHGEDGWLVPPGDAAALASAVRMLMADPQLRARLGAAGRKRALALGADQHVDRLLAHYAEAA